jgi:hypothetical protein
LLGGQAVQHYAVAEHLKGGDALSEFWISTSTGLLLKRYGKLADDEVTMSYDYTNVKAPF